MNWYFSYFLIPSLQPSSGTYDFDICLALLFQSYVFKTAMHALSAFKTAVFWQGPEGQLSCMVLSAPAAVCQAAYGSVSHTAKILRAGCCHTGPCWGRFLLKRPKQNKNSIAIVQMHGRMITLTYTPAFSVCQHSLLRTFNKQFKRKES